MIKIHFLIFNFYFEIILFARIKLGVDTKVQVESKYLLIEKSLNNTHSSNLNTSISFREDTMSRSPFHIIHKH